MMLAGIDTCSAGNTLSLIDLNSRIAVLINGCNIGTYYTAGSYTLIASYTVVIGMNQFHNYLLGIYYAYY